MSLETDYYVYIVCCADDTYYTGITTDIHRRIKEHNGLIPGKIGAKYTRTRRPLNLVYQKKYQGRSAATKEEMRIKKMSRASKKALISGHTNELFL